MKAISKLFIKYFLKIITRFVLLRHQPFIIAIAGSTNKTFVKEAISANLRARGYDVRSNQKSFNTEFGLPLAILNLPSGYSNASSWINICVNAFFSLFQASFPKILVLELGISDLGDMKYLLSIIKPKIAIITDITQRYLEGFEDMDELVDEYRQLSQNLTTSDNLILNYDNIRVRKFSENTKAKIIYFSLDAESVKSINDKNVNIIFSQIKQEKSDCQNILISNRDTGSIEEKSILKHGNHHVYAQLIVSAVDSIVFSKFHDIK